jgi:hypothetical protein
MQRRQFIQTAGAATVLGSGISSAQSLGQTLGDAALRLNPLIQPEERVEKRVFAGTNPEIVSWETTFCRSPMPPYEVGSGRRAAYLHALVTANFVPVIGAPLVRRDAPPTERLGFYFYFKTTVALLGLPNVRPEEFISSTGKYFDCSSTKQLFTGVISKNFVTIDYRKIKLTEGNKTYHPTHEVYHELNASGGYPVDAPALLRQLTKPSSTPGRDYTSKSMWVENTLLFDIPLRPLRFTLELPPMVIQGIEVPLPTCYFEPFDISTNKWV